MAEKSSLWFFQNVDLYDLLCPVKTGQADQSHKMVTFNKNDFIYFTHEPSKAIYMIEEGRVKVGHVMDNGKEVVKAILSKGEIFGELALAGEEQRADYAQALDNKTRVCPMTVDEMKALMAENQELSFKVVKLIGDRVQKLERKLESLVFKNARTRVLEFLRDAAEWKGQKVGFEIMIRTSLTHQDIAGLTGSSRQTVTTILNELKDSNIINFNRRQILIRDLESLKRMIQSA